MGLLWERTRSWSLGDSSTHLFQRHSPSLCSDDSSLGPTEFTVLDWGSLPGWSRYVGSRDGGSPDERDTDHLGVREDLTEEVMCEP